jgi:hypothetical protein
MKQAITLSIENKERSCKNGKLNYRKMGYAPIESRD